MQGGPGQYFCAFLETWVPHICRIGNTFIDEEVGEKELIKL